MVSFWHNAALAVYQSFIGFYLVLDKTSVEETILSLPRLDAWIICVTELLVNE